MHVNRLHWRKTNESEDPLRTMIFPSILCSMLSNSQTDTLFPLCKCLKMTFCSVRIIQGGRIRIRTKVGIRWDGRKRTMGWTRTRWLRLDTVVQVSWWLSWDQGEDTYCWWKMERMWTDQSVQVVGEASSFSTVYGVESWRRLVHVWYCFVGQHVRYWACYLSISSRSAHQSDLCSFRFMNALLVISSFSLRTVLTFQYFKVSYTLRTTSDRLL